MKRLSVLLTVLFLVLGVATSAGALTYGIGYSAINTGSYFVQSDSLTFNANYGVYSAGLALAYDQDGFDVDAYYCGVLNGWAAAYASNSFAAAGTYDGTSGSMAAARAGDGYGEEAGAVAGTFATAYGLYMQNESTVTFSIDYDLYAEIGSDDPDGFSTAGAAALLGIYQAIEGEGEIAGDYDLISLTGSYMDDYNDLLSSGILEFEVELGPGFYNIFAGTAAWAYAEVPSAETAPVPEPATMFLLGTGLIGLAGLGRRKFFNQAKSLDA